MTISIPPPEPCEVRHDKGRAISAPLQQNVVRRRDVREEAPKSIPIEAAACKPIRPQDIAAEALELGQRLDLHEHYRGIGRATKLEPLPGNLARDLQVELDASETHHIEDAQHHLGAANLPQATAAAMLQHQGRPDAARSSLGALPRRRLLEKGRHRKIKVGRRSQWKSKTGAD